MRILVVEDNARVASFLMKGLREESYAVDLAETGDDGLHFVISGSYDLIVLDIMLPGMDGFAFTRSLRETGDDTPILMLTARDDTNDKVRGLDCGADDYLTKPFAFDEFLARIRALLRRRSEDRDAVLQLADLTLDPSRHTVTRAHQRIDLTPKEYALLELLLRNKNRILTRTSILEHVWDMNFASETNVLDVLIRYLRKKIDDGFSSKLIHTVRGVGYTLKKPGA